MQFAIIVAVLGPVVATVAGWRIEGSVDAQRDVEIGAAVRRFWSVQAGAAMWIAVVSAAAGEPGAGVTLGVIYLLWAIAWSLHYGDGMVRIPFDSPVHHSLSGPVDTRALHVDLAELTGRDKDRRTGARHLAAASARPPGIIRSILLWLRDVQARRRGPASGPGR